MSERSKFLGVANVARRNPDGSFHGDMLDGEFADAISAAGCQIPGSPNVLIGAGGAGSAIALSLLDRGASKLAIHDVDRTRHDALIAKIALNHRNKVAEGSDDPFDAAVVVNATPLGMSAEDPMPLDISQLVAATFVGDVVTVPEMTPLLKAAREKGCRIQTGVGMFQSSVGLMADFFGAAIRDSDGLVASIVPIRHAGWRRFRRGSGQGAA